MKNFLLYFGNARAGSTWLHGELSRRTDCNFPQKEIFIFQDFNPVPGPEGFDKTKYFENMAQLVNVDGIRLTGDLTPSNENATKEQLRWFKQNADNVGLNVLPTMTLRDPISQVISYTMMRMSTKKFLETNSMGEIKSWYINQLVNNTPGVIPESVTEILNSGKPGFEESLLSWRETIENVTEVFGKLHLNFYETMFTNESISNLFLYLELPDYIPPSSSKDAVKIKDFPVLNESQITELFTLYPFKQEDYDYAVSRFGKEIIDRIWTSSDEMNFSRKVWSFGKHPEFSDDEKHELYEKYPFMRENYDFAVSRFGEEFINSIWWNPYK
jgi:hypothetical protein